MRRYNDTYYTDKVLLKGYVYYEDKEPVKGAIVILEQLFRRDRSCKCNKDEEAVYSTYTITNCYGEFCFFIYDRTKYYKIKIFDNQYSYNTHHNCNIDLE